MKVIKDRDERPKGFGYVEFEELEDLKGALTKSGSVRHTKFSSVFSVCSVRHVEFGRTNCESKRCRAPYVLFLSNVRPPASHNISAKERTGFGGSEDPKFSGEWRRQGPLPDSDSRDSSRRRYDGPPGDAPTPVSETSSDWRSNRPTRAPPPEAEAVARRKTSGFLGSESGGAADREETWTIGSKFKPSEDEGSGRKLGTRSRGDMGPPSSVPPDSPADNDWRSGPRAGLSSRSSTSRESVILPMWNEYLHEGAATSSTPPTPQLARRKLELLPRSGTTSSTPSPLASPKMAQSNPANRPSPFGAAKCVSSLPTQISCADSSIALGLWTLRREKRPSRSALTRSAKPPRSVSASIPCRAAIRVKE